MRAEALSQKAINLSPSSVGALLALGLDTFLKESKILK